MDATGPTLVQRVAAVLHAKQYVVFFAISLSALTTVAPLLLSWARKSAPFDTLVQRSPEVFYESARSRAVWLGAAALAYLLVFTWFRAAYLRSLLGRFHLRPQDGTQFVRLLALELVTEALAALSAWSTANGIGPAALFVAPGAVIASVALLYADYAIVASALGPLRAAAASWDCLRRNFWVSLLVVMVALWVQSILVFLLDARATAGVMRSLPVLVVYIVMLGVITFVVDVALTVVYLRTVEEAQSSA